MLKTLSESENIAVREFKQKIINAFGDAEFVLFGSKARNEGDAFSDIDMLVLLKEEPSNLIEEMIFDIGFEVELKHDVILGIIVHSKAFWNSKGSLMPIHKEIERDGIQI